MKLIIVAALALAGCASAPPNTPGAGYGKTYTPIVDMQGVDQGRYAADLNDCRHYAGMIDEGKAVLNAAIGGAILGAVVSAALGGHSYQNQQVGVAVGGGALARAGAAASAKQERILINCLAGRGYRPLDGGYVPVATPMAQPAPVAAAQPVPAGQPAALFSPAGAEMAIPPGTCGWKDALNYVCR